MEPLMTQLSKEEADLHKVKPPR